MASIIIPSVPSESRAGRFGVYGGRYVPETLMAALVELERELAGLDFLADYEFAMRGERACGIAAVEHLRHTRNFRALSGGFSEGAADQSAADNPLEQISGAVFHLIPSAVFYHNEMAIAQMHQQWLLPAVDVERRVVSPELIRQAVAANEAMRKHWSPNTILAAMLLPSMEGCALKFSHAQNAVDLARVACALDHDDDPGQRPIFTSSRHGDVNYAVLAPTCPARHTTTWR